MTLSKWLIGYGAFLFFCGVSGYLSNPIAAKTALMSGSAFGALAIMFGFLLGKGLGWAKWAALATTLMLSAVFSWRSVVSWQKVMDGEPKWFAASLITLMFLGTIATLIKILSSKS